jgi:hypothetical protein
MSCCARHPRSSPRSETHRWPSSSSPQVRQGHPYTPYRPLIIHYTPDVPNQPIHLANPPSIISSPFYLADYPSLCYPLVGWWCRPLAEWVSAVGPITPAAPRHGRTGPPRAALHPTDLPHRYTPLKTSRSIRTHIGVLSMRYYLTLLHHSHLISVPFPLPTPTTRSVRRRPDHAPFLRALAALRWPPAVLGRRRGGPARGDVAGAASDPLPARWLRPAHLHLSGWHPLLPYHMRGVENLNSERSVLATPNP